MSRQLKQLLAVPAKQPWLVVLATLLLTLIFGAYTARNLRIDTDPARMLDPNLPFLKAQREFTREFPMFNRLLVAVVEAPGAAAAEDAATALTQALSDRTALYQSIYHPGHDPFFNRNGLLYLSTDALWDMDARLAEAAPFLGAVATDRSLRGLFRTLDLSLNVPVEPAQQEQLIGLYTRITEAVEAELGGRSSRIYWRDDLVPHPGGGSGVARDFVVLQPRLDYSRIDAAGAALRDVRAEAARVEAANPGVRVRLTGPVALDQEELASVEASAGITTGLSLTLVFALLIWGLRSPWLIAAVLLNLLVGLVWTTAFATAAVGSFNLITVNFAVLFIGMGVDFGIQYALRYREQHAGAKRERLLAASRGIAPALWLAALAAGLTFFAFTPTQYRGLAELGLIAGASMFIAWLSALVLLPALLALMPAPAVQAEHAAGPGTVRPDFRARWATPIMGMASLLTFAGLAALPALDFDFNPLNLKDPQAPSVATYRDLLADRNATPYTAQLLATSAEAAAQLSQQLQALPVVDKVVSLASFVPRDQEDKLAIIDGMRINMEAALMAMPAPAPSAAENQAALEAYAARLLATPAQAAGRLLEAQRRLGDALSRLAAVTRSAPERLAEFETGLIGDLSRVIDRLSALIEAETVTPESLPQDLVRRYRSESGQYRLEVYPKADLAHNPALVEFVQAIRAVDPAVSGAPVGIYAGGEAVVHATFIATLLALLANAFLFRFWMGRWSETLLALLPLLLALIAMGGSSVLLQQPFNLANIIALPLLIGLNNAYGAYLVIRTREVGAIAMLKTATPRAVLVGGLTAAASFATLAAASHPGMATMGIFIGLAIVWSLGFALLVLPALLIRLEQGSQSA